MPNHIKKKSSQNQLKKQKVNNQYQIVVRWSEEDGCYLAYAPALSGCMTHGDTPEEAISKGEEAVVLWLEEAIARGDKIPKPIHGYSGKMTLRMPSSLHQKIAEKAEREGVSINQWVVYKLASTADSSDSHIH